MANWILKKASWGTEVNNILITSNKSVVKNDKADEDTIKAWEKDKESIERILQLLARQNEDGDTVTEQSEYSDAKLK